MPEPGEMSKRDPKKVSIDLWTRTRCPHCATAKAVFEAKGVKYRERRLKPDNMAQQRQFAMATGGARSVPQIVIEGEHIGGAGDLVQLNRKGELDWRLGLGPRPQRTTLQRFGDVMLGR